MKKVVYFILFLSLLILFPNFYQTADAVETTTLTKVEDTIDVKDSSSAVKTVPANNVKKLEEPKIIYKEPVSIKHTAKKFLFAMFGVALSSIILFVMLTIYNKIRNRVISAPSQDYKNTLTSPNNLRDAVNIFLEKTK